MKIQLNKGFAQVDDLDFPWLNKFNWTVNNQGYAWKSNWGRKPSHFLMHRLIMRAQKGQEVDHINGDRLDNRRENLRIATHKQNSYNSKSRGGSSQYKGVTWDKQTNKWRSLIRENGKVLALGRFDSEQQAARAYDLKAKEIHKEFAVLNF